jgi:hypothetical protein
MRALLPLVSDMGRIQVYFYLVLLAGLFLGAGFLMAAFSLPAVARLASEPGGRPLAVLVGGALAMALVFVLGLGVWFCVGLFTNGG